MSFSKKKDFNIFYICKKEFVFLMKSDLKLKVTNVKNFFFRLPLNFFLNSLTNPKTKQVSFKLKPKLFIIIFRLRH